ncbi:unnamed protein product [Vicia faba]|uniref:Uncharacterized protein n=1 Tax=Vicia faba TaxID=3906 RepID=A0AAV1ALG5_VICFA|nr:unnamed protein product [Vicia faba]
MCHFVNIYSSCDISLKMKMWEEIIRYKQKWVGEWCLGGDFNTIRFINKIIGRGVYSRLLDSTEFNDFIALSELVNLPTGSVKFSWCRGRLGSLSRIDQFLLSEGFVEMMFAASQEIGVKDISNHSLVWLKCNNLNWVKKLFRTLN